MVVLTDTCKCVSVHERGLPAHFSLLHLAALHNNCSTTCSGWAVELVQILHWRSFCAAHWNKAPLWIISKQQFTTMCVFVCLLYLCLIVWETYYFCRELSINHSSLSQLGRVVATTECWHFFVNSGVDISQQQLTWWVFYKLILVFFRLIMFKYQQNNKYINYQCGEDFSQIGKNIKSTIELITE